MNSTEPTEVIRKGGGFGMVMHKIIRDGSLAPRSRLLYAILTTYADQGREAFPSRKTLATNMGVSIDTVDRAVEGLVNAGILEVQARFSGGSQRSSVYVLLDMAPGVTVSTPLAASVRPPSRISAAPLAAPVRPQELDQENKTKEQTGLNTCPTTSSEPDLFDQFWQVFPGKKAKLTAKKAWAKALTKAPHWEIIAGAVRYRDDPNREATFTAYPATWLNGGRWEDEPLPTRLNNKADRRRAENERQNEVWTAQAVMIDSTPDPWKALTQ